MEEMEFGEKSYNILWLIGILKSGRHEFTLGICENTGNIAFIKSDKDALSPLIIHDVIVDKNICEDGVRCLCFDCKYNMTDNKSLAKMLRIKKGKIEEERYKLTKRMIELNNKLKELKLDPNKKSGALVFKDAPIMVDLQMT